MPIIIIIINKHSVRNAIQQEEKKLSISSTNWLRGNSDKTNSFHKTLTTYPERKY